MIGIEIIGWEGTGWIFHLLLGMIDQGRRLVLWDDNRILEAAVADMDVEILVTEVDMEDPENMLLSFFFFAYLILLSHFILHLPSKSNLDNLLVISVLNLFFLLIEK